MTEKRYLLKKWLGYEPYYIDTKQEYVDEAELRFELDGYKTMSDEQVVTLLNENEQLKQVFRDIVSKLDIEIAKDNTIFSVTVVVDSKMFQKIKEVCK